MLKQTIISVELERVGLPSHPEPRFYLIISQQCIFDNDANYVSLSKAYINLEDKNYKQLVKSWVAGIAVRDVKLTPAVYNGSEESRKYAMAVDSIRTEWLSWRNSNNVKKFLASPSVMETINEFTAYVNKRLLDLDVLPFW